jgi:hypothetical protein
MKPATRESALDLVAEIINRGLRRREARARKSVQDRRRGREAHGDDTTPITAIIRPNVTNAGTHARRSPTTDHGQHRDLRRS